MHTMGSHTMGSGNRNKVFFLSLLDQTLFQLLNGFPEMIVFAELILKLNDRLTHPHRAPLEMPGYIRYPVPGYCSCKIGNHTPVLNSFTNLK
jgi:hypothetical protein